MTAFLLTGKGKNQNNSPKTKQKRDSKHGQETDGESYETRISKRTCLINEETPFHVIKMYKLCSKIPRPYFSRDGQHPEMGTPVQHSML